MKEARETIRSRAMKEARETIRRIVMKEAREVLKVAKAVMAIVSNSDIRKVERYTEKFIEEARELEIDISISFREAVLHEDSIDVSGEHAPGIDERKYIEYWELWDEAVGGAAWDEMSDEDRQKIVKAIDKVTDKFHDKWVWSADKIEVDVRKPRFNKRYVLKLRLFAEAQADLIDGKLVVGFSGYDRERLEDSLYTDIDEVLKEEGEW